MKRLTASAVVKHMKRTGFNERFVKDKHVKNALVLKETVSFMKALFVLPKKKLV